MIFIHKLDEYILTTDIKSFKVDQIHKFLSHAYWSPGISYDAVIQKINNALSFALIRGTEQVGFARFITDRVSFAYLADVYIVESERGKGLSKWMMEKMLEHPYLFSVSKIMLATKDAHGLYKKYGFSILANKDDHIMVRNKKST